MSAFNNNPNNPNTGAYPSGNAYDAQSSSTTSAGHPSLVQKVENKVENALPGHSSNHGAQGSYGNDQYGSTTTGHSSNPLSSNHGSTGHSSNPLSSNHGTTGTTGAYDQSNTGAFGQSNTGEYSSTTLGSNHGTTTGTAGGYGNTHDSSLLNQGGAHHTSGSHNPLSSNTHSSTGHSSNPLSSNTHSGTHSSNPLSSDHSSHSGSHNPLSSNTHSTTGSSNPLSSNHHSSTGSHNPLSSTTHSHGTGTTGSNYSDPIHGLSSDGNRVAGQHVGNFGSPTSNTHSTTGSSNPLSSDHSSTGSHNPLSSNAHSHGTGVHDSATGPATSHHTAGHDTTTGTKPSMADKITGKVEALIGKATKDHTKVAEGELKATEGKAAVEARREGTF